MSAVDWHGIARLIGHPTVVRVIELCATQSRSPRQLADFLDQPLGQVSYHVRKLADLDVLVLVHTEPRRGAIEHYYRLSPSVQRRNKRDASSGEQPVKMQDASQPA